MAATVRELHEEHALVDVPQGDGSRPGDRIELLVSCCPATINLHDAYHVVEGETVVDIWPICGRGPGLGSIPNRRQSRGERPVSGERD
jgi:D-serine deaminase-like pyridoxal phosphate-dependent protein